MANILYFLTYGSIFLIASLPFWLLYRISDFFYFLIRISGYRRKVVVDNLKKAFPEKTEREIRQIANGYFRYMCDLTLETFKILTISPETIKKRCVFNFPPWLEDYTANQRSMIFLMGHCANWEWAAPSFAVNNPTIQLVSIYRPLSNIPFDRVLRKIRSRFGARIVAASNTLRVMVELKGQLTATAFVADQSARPSTSYWTKFLNQDTGFFRGPERLGKKFNYPIIYTNITRTKRGYYDIKFEQLFSDPSKAEEEEILEAFARRLEEQIRKDPVTWLWSHRRWKHKKPLQMD